MERLLKYGSAAIIGLLALFYAAKGCPRAATYHGFVVDSDTGIPIYGIEVTGHYLYNTKFSPSMDGLFKRRSGAVSVTTDKDGRFNINMRGFNRWIAVYHAIYDTVEVSVDKWQPNKEIYLRLHSANTEGQ